MISGIHVEFLRCISSHFYFNQFSTVPQKNWHFSRHKHRFELSYGTCFFSHERAMHPAWDASFKVSLVAWYNDSDSLPPFMVPVCRWLWKNKILIVRSWSHVTPRKFDGWEMYKLLLGMYTQYNSGIDMDNYDSLPMTSFGLYFSLQNYYRWEALVVMVGTIVLWKPTHRDFYNNSWLPTQVFSRYKKIQEVLLKPTKATPISVVTLLPIWWYSLHHNVMCRSKSSGYSEKLCSPRCMNRMVPWSAADNLWIWELLRQDCFSWIFCGLPNEFPLGATYMDFSPFEDMVPGNWQAKTRDTQSHPFPLKKSQGLTTPSVWSASPSNHLTRKATQTLGAKVLWFAKACTWKQWLHWQVHGPMVGPKMDIKQNRWYMMGLKGRSTFPIGCPVPCFPENGNFAYKSLLV